MNYEQFSEKQKKTINQLIEFASKLTKENLNTSCNCCIGLYELILNGERTYHGLIDIFGALCLSNFLTSKERNEVLNFAKTKKYWLKFDPVKLIK